MLLDWLDLKQAAATIRVGVERALADGAATPDLGGGLNTVQMTDIILQCM